MRWHDGLGRTLVCGGIYKTGNIHVNGTFGFRPYGAAELNNVSTKDLDSDQGQGRTAAAVGCSPSVDMDWPLDPEKALEKAMVLWR